MRDSGIRVKLNCPGRITPSRVRAQRASAPHGHGDDRDLRALPIGQVIESGMQPLLRLPGVPDHCGRLARLASLQVDARLRAVPVAPCRLNQHMPTMTVARLRDRAESLSGAARVFARDQPEIAGQLRQTLEATPIDDRRGKDHR